MAQRELVKKIESIEWEYTTKVVTNCGDMRLMKELIDKTGKS